MAASFKISGFEGVDRALRELKKPTAKAVVRRVLKGALEPIAEMARALAPVDEGDLRDSIGVSSTLIKGARRNEPRSSAEEKATRVTVYAGTADRNGVPREFGSSRSEAHPFLRPAWEGGKERALAAVQERMGAELRKAIDRAAKKAGSK